MSDNLKVLSNKAITSLKRYLQYNFAQEVIQRLTDREIFILETRYGTQGDKLATYHSMEPLLNLTRCRIRVIHNNACNKLKKPFINRYIEKKLAYQKNPLIYKPIEELQLTLRGNNSLKENNIFYVWQLILFSEHQLSSFRNLGRKSIHEIKEALDMLNLTLGMKISES